MTARIFGIAGSTNSAEDFRLSAGGLFVPASAINDRTGVTSTPVLTGTGNFTATVGAFSCLIDGTSNSLQGSYWVTLDIATTVTIGAANTQARVDLISMQILDNAYDGSGQQKAQLVVTAGTPAGSPVAPATPANAIALWTVPVAANATSITWGSATAVFPYTTAVGGIVPVRSSSDQPPAVNGVQYRHRLDVGAGGASPTEWSTDGVTWNPVAAASAMAKIGQTTLGASAASITLSVPAGYSAVVAHWRARSDNSSNNVLLLAELNGDTGANYSYEYLEGAGTVASAAGGGGVAASITVGRAAAATETANYFGSGSFTIPDVSASGYKVLTGTAMKPSSTTGNNYSGTYGGQWQNTAALTSVTIIPLSGQLVAGSRLTLYGLL